MGQLSATMQVMEQKMSDQCEVWSSTTSVCFFFLKKKRKSDVMKPCVIRLHFQSLERPRDHKLPRAQEKPRAAPQPTHPE